MTSPHPRLLLDRQVAWLTPTLGRGGQLLYLGPLLDEFARRCGAFRVFTVLAGDVSAARFEVCVVGSAARIQSKRAREGRANLDAAGGAIVTPGVVRALAAYRPQLVVLNEFGLQSIYGLAYARWARPRPAVLLLAETRPRFDDDHRWLVSMRLRMRRVLARAADAVLTNNEAGRAYLEGQLGVDARHIVARPYLVSDMGVRQHARQSAQRTHTGGPVRFLFVGRLVQLKGVQLALDACATLLPKYERRFVFEIVGDGPYRVKLERQAQRLGLGEHVHFHGNAAYAEMGRHYEAAHVFLFPTLADFRALVTFEALSAGLPLLVSIHDGGVAETVVDEDNGFRFDPRATDVLGALMARFIDEPALVRRFSSRSLDRARNYRLPAAVDALVQAAEMAIERRAERQQTRR